MTLAKSCESIDRNTRNSVYGQRESTAFKCYRRTRQVFRYDPPERLSQDVEKHKLVPIVTDEKKLYPQRRCRVCFVGFNWYICEYCNLPLRKLACFEHYYSTRKY